MYAKWQDLGFFEKNRDTLSGRIKTQRTSKKIITAHISQHSQSNQHQIEISSPSQKQKEKSRSPSHPQKNPRRHSLQTREQWNQQHHHLDDDNLLRPSPQKFERP